MPLNPKEDATYHGRYGKCTDVTEGKHVVLVYPKVALGWDSATAGAVVQMLDRGYEALQKVWSSDPSTVFNCRVVVGYRHPSDEGGKECSAGWGWGNGQHPNWVNIPWYYIGKEEEPLRACSHELVHPFVHIADIRGSNRHLVEGICDAFRGTVAERMGLTTYGSNEVARMFDESAKGLANLSPHGQQYQHVAACVLAFAGATRGTTPTVQQLARVVTSLNDNPDFYKVALPCPWLEQMLNSR